MRSLSILPVILAVIAASRAGAQTMLESAAAAAGGSVAGVAGKSISNGIDTVLGKVADVAKSAATEDAKKGSRVAPAVPPVPKVRLTAKEKAELEAAAKSKEHAAGTTSHASGPQARLQPSATAPNTRVNAAPAPQAAAPPAAPAGPTLQDLQSVSAGATRAQVVDKLGEPSSRISMSNDDGFVEIMKFRNQDGSVGSVRVVNGKVAEVKTAQ